MTTDFLTRVRAEFDRARELFPPPNTTFNAMVEEAGEVAKALMDLQLGKITRAEFETECVQLGAMAMRLYSEGDPLFPLSVQDECQPDITRLGERGDFSGF